MKWRMLLGVMRRLRCSSMAKKSTAPWPPSELASRSGPRLKDANLPVPNHKRPRRPGRQGDSPGSRGWDARTENLERNSFERNSNFCPLAAPLVPPSARPPCGCKSQVSGDVMGHGRCPKSFRSGRRQVLREFGGRAQQRRRGTSYYSSLKHPAAAH